MLIIRIYGFYNHKKTVEKERINIEKNYSELLDLLKVASLDRLPEPIYLTKETRNNTGFLSKIRQANHMRSNYSIKEEVFKKNYPVLYLNGYREANIYGYCLIISDLKRLITKELLYCNGDLELEIGYWYDNNIFVKAKLPKDFYLLSTMD